jgi:hypothetical protein
MNINEEVKKLPSVDRAFYDGQVRPGDAYELLQRKQALTQGLIDNDPAITSNRNAAVLAIHRLGERISPPETPADANARDRKNVAEIAQRYRNNWDDQTADEVLARAGMTLDDLSPRPSNPEAAQRDSERRSEYFSERTKAIAALRLSRGLSKSAATVEFDSESDSVLRKNTNQKFRFRLDRPY